jgi:FMN phosphatase YigB (HAD superfamily)
VLSNNPCCNTERKNVNAEVVIFDCFGVLINEETFTVIPPGVALLHCAIADQKKIYMLTNATQKRMEQLQEKYPAVFTIFIDIVTPCETGFKKPSPEHFNYLLAKHTLIASHCLFIDDAVSNTHTAQSLGMHIHLFVPDNTSRVEEVMQ